MGSWIKAKRNEHKCDYPKYGVPHDTAVGDVWECKCGRQWRVESIKVIPGYPHSPDPREHGDTYKAEFVEVPTGIVPR